MGVISSKTTSIDEDSKTIKKLLAAAKFGRWNEVWQILGSPGNPKKSFFMNVIPEDRRWSVLHQAVYYNNQDVIKTLLRFAACDSSVRAKDGISEVGHSGQKTPKEIAEQFKYQQLANLLEAHTNNLDTQDLPTFYTEMSDIDNEGLGLLRVTVAAYKQTFHPAVIDVNKPVTALLNDIFRYVYTSDNWTSVRDKISHTLYMVCKPACEIIEKCTTKQKFFEKIIQVYTNESTQLYTFCNTAMRRQRENGYKPTANDLALGPYILMFHLLLQCWGTLKRESGPTYRKMLIRPSDLQMYQRGTKFVWLSFVSSSVVPAKAEPFPTCGPSGDQQILFKIDNTSDSQWKPRNIEAYAEFEENERVYPAGVSFLITRRSQRNGTTEVHLKLLSDINETSGAQVVKQQATKNLTAV